MSIASEIQRLQTAKQDIITALAAIGIDIPSGTTLDGFADIIHHDYSQDYLTFVALESGTFSCSINVNYSLDNGATWTTLTAETNTPTVTAGSKIMWKGDNSWSEGTFSSTGNFNVEGNVMSLRFGDNFSGQTDIYGMEYVFAELFNFNENLISVQNMVLPATILAYRCYWRMFMSCTNLTTFPGLSPATELAEDCYRQMFANTNITTIPSNYLPATTLADNCYIGMFASCRSLTDVSNLILPATTLAKSCYMGMFNGCTGLTTAPELPATTLADYCYENMFEGCTNLNYIKCLATDISANYCTDNWVNGVASTGTFVKNASMSSWTTGVSGIPTNWTVEDA